MARARLRQTLSASGFVALSSRERQILALYPVEQDAKSMAYRLGISPQTVKNHVTSLLAKLGVSRLGVAAIIYDREVRDGAERRLRGERRRTERRVEVDRRMSPGESDTGTGACH